MDEIVWVQIQLTINGEDVFYTSSVPQSIWEDQKFKLDFIQHLKRRCIDQATRGMEPIIREFDEMPPGMGWGGIPEMAHGSSVEIGSSNARSTD